MLQPEMIFETVQIMREAIEQGLTVNVLVNNRADENAPLIAQEIAQKFLSKDQSTTGIQKDSPVASDFGM